jgi:hypothetical protein
VHAGANCGPVADGCGGILECGNCEGGSICGGDNNPSVCSGTTPSCQNLCLQQVSCPAGSKTTISGVVRAPTPPGFGSADPLYNALVYIPNGPVAPFTKGVACEQCGAAVSGNPLVSATSAFDGSFTLANAPVGSNIPLVIQIGRWRRQVTIPTVNACVDNPLPASLTRLPRNHTEGDIPFMAMVTGKADPLECVLRKIGVQDSEFTRPGGGGRVEVYVNNGSYLSNTNMMTDTMNNLTGSKPLLDTYDMVIFACAGMEIDQQTTNQNNVIDYANAGGRVFATHFSYVWFFDIQPWEGTATWSVSGGHGGFGGGGFGNGSVTAMVDTSFDRGVAFAKWLKQVGASSTAGQVSINQVRNDFTAVNTQEAQRWLYDSTQPLHYTFNTPVGSMNSGAQCGRALFSDFHVSTSGDNGGGGNNVGQFPSECDSLPLSAQEKALEFMMFDLASCVPSGGFVIGGNP